ncbi:MAG: amidohydrolase [Bacteroidales bacterium]|nr:amidohydrolase [Bacteroidales bacterium]
MNELTVSAVQMNIAWENYNDNFNKVVTLIKNLAQHTNIIILPEMFLTGFSMNSKIAIRQHHPYLQEIMLLANQYNVSVCGSLMIEENEKLYNRFVYFQPANQLFIYNKRHLFRMANEHHTYTIGNKKTIIQEKGFHISPFICYDLRFPVWMRNVKNEYDVCIVVANWPHARIDAWHTLLKARAIENQCFVIGVNRIGTDGNNVFYSGGTVIYDFKGTIIAKAQDNNEDIINATIYLQDLKEYRHSFPAYLDADQFTIIH